MKSHFICELRENNYFGVPKLVAENYITSLIEHINYVIEAGQNIGVTNDQLACHDDSKWGESEFIGYAIHFKGGGLPDEFSRAWLHHIHFNPHHWQHWIFPDGYSPKFSQVENGIVEMPEHYALEMVADWMGASRAYTGSWDMKDWLTSNLPKIKVHSRTKKHLGDILSDLNYSDIVSLWDSNSL